MHNGRKEDIDTEYTPDDFDDEDEEEYDSDWTIVMTKTIFKNTKGGIKMYVITNDLEGQVLKIDDYDEDHEDFDEDEDYEESEEDEDLKKIMMILKMKNR